MYCKNCSCFDEEPCKEQCNDCREYDCCDIDREMGDITIPLPIETLTVRAKIVSVIDFKPKSIL